MCAGHAQVAQDELHNEDANERPPAAACTNFNHEGQGRGCGEREARDEVALVH